MNIVFFSWLGYEFDDFVCFFSMELCMVWEGKFNEEGIGLFVFDLGD